MEKRTHLEQSEGPKKKRFRDSKPSLASEKDINDLTIRTSKRKTNTCTYKGDDKVDTESQDCSIKLEPPQIDEPDDKSDCGNELTSALSITSAICKSESFQRDLQGTESSDVKETGLVATECVVIVSESEVKDLVEFNIVDRKLPHHAAKNVKADKTQPVSRKLPHYAAKSVKAEETRSVSKEISKKQFKQCEHCGFTSKYKSAVKRHVSQCGKGDKSGPRRCCIFPNCKAKFYHVSLMVKHMEAMHEAPIGMKTLYFSSPQEFHRWKEEEEIANFTYFTKHRGDSLTKKGLYTVYVCQNDGSGKCHRRKDQPARLTNRKSRKGMVKTGATCPSRMIVNVLKDEVKVKYFYSHNHELKFENTQHHPISRKGLEYIHSRFSVGVSPKQVQKELRNKVIYREKGEGEGKECIKGQLVSLRTLTAIKHEFVSSFRLDKDDANSVFLLVKEWEKNNHNPIMLYKPQYFPIIIGKSDDYLSSQTDIFFIALQTEAQFKMLNSPISRLLCVDTSCFNGRHGFYLLSLIIHNDDGKAIPVVHLISNTKTREMLRYFFASVKEHCPNLDLYGVLTDLEYSGWEDILSVFECVSFIHVCQWHIKKDWKKKLESMVEGSVQHEMMEKLTTMMEERDEQRTEEMVESFKAKYERIHPKFISFFQTNIASQPEVWATSCRDLTLCNSITDMYCKDFHNTLEVFFSKSKLKKRIDDLLLLLMRIVPNVEEKATQSFHIRDNHTKSLDIADEDVTELDGIWTVVCQEDRNTTFDVVRLASECQEVSCAYKCQDLPCGNLCSHMYSCSCGEGSDMCEHIHKVHSGKSNVIIICSSDFETVIKSNGKRDLMPQEGQNDTKIEVIKDESSLLSLAYDNLNRLSSYVGEPCVQSKLLPHIVKTLETLVMKCQKVHDSK